jgi:hypothetical protein
MGSMMAHHWGWPKGQKMGWQRVQKRELHLDWHWDWLMVLQMVWHLDWHLDLLWVQKLGLQMGQHSAQHLVWH